MINTKERQDLARKIARVEKINRLRRSPGMDEVAIALNASPTWREIEAIEFILEQIGFLGYGIIKKPEGV